MQAEPKFCFPNTLTKNELNISRLEKKKKRMLYNLALALLFLMIMKTEGFLFSLWLFSVSAHSVEFLYLEYI